MKRKRAQYQLPGGLLLILWLSTVLTGQCKKSIEVWPNQDLQLAVSGYTRVLFVADDVSLNALAEQLNKTDYKKVTTYVVLDEPPIEIGNASKGDTWMLKKAIGEGKIFIDRSHLLRRTFNCNEHSQIFLYNNSGKLVHQYII